MKLHTLEVEDFRGIHRATVSFGPGLTVLHGPNELGKSTLVEAIHAALFTPSGATAGNDHVQWGTNRPATVVLTFEHQDHLWRVTKRFGHKTSAKLEKSDIVDPPRFREEMAGKGVDGHVRDLLAWGIAPPGGKGAQRTPSSFLLTALVGRQGEVQRVFEASLDGDTDEAGRSLVNQSLGALDTDPLVGALVDKLTLRVEPFFSDTGKLKTAADSPLVKRQNYLRTQQELLARLEADTAKGEGIQAEVVRLQDTRDGLVASLREAREAAAAADAQRAQAEQRAALQATVNDLRARVEAADALHAKAASLEAQLAACDATLVTLRDEERAALDTAEQARTALQVAAEDLARAKEALALSADVSKSAADKRRAERELAKVAVEARLTQVRAADEAAAEAQRFVAALEAARATRDACAADVTRAERLREHATLQRALAALRDRQRDVAAAAAALDTARRDEAAAQERLDAATVARRDADTHLAKVVSEPLSDAVHAARTELAVLAAVDAQLVVHRVRAEVVALEAVDADAKQTRATAKTRRDEANDLDSAAARRTLPTPEQVAAWRGLDAEMRADAASAGGRTSSAGESSSARTVEVRTTSPVPAAAAFVAGWVLAAAAAMFGLGLSMPAALGVGAVVGAALGFVVWTTQRSRTNAETMQAAQAAEAARAAVAEQRARRQERWRTEVMPSLRAADLASLADYDGAVADVARQKGEAQRLRADAAVLDDTAVAREREAATLESKRVELERLVRAVPQANADAVGSALAACGGDADAVRRRVVAVQAQLEAEHARLRREAEAAVEQAEAVRAAAQSDVDARAKQVAAAEATLAHTRQQVDEAELSRVQARLAELGATEASDSSVDEATTVLDEAKRAHTSASTQVQGLEAAVAQAHAKALERAAALGDDLEMVRGNAERELAAIVAELNVAQPRSLFDESAMAQTTVDEATVRHAALEAQRAATLAAHASHVERVKASEQERVVFETSLASVRGQLSGYDVPALRARLDAALNDPAFQEAAAIDLLDADAAAALVVTLQATLEQCTSDLAHAKGQLELTSGHVGSERLAQQREAVALADADVKECERTERGALRLLRELEKAERERATHLGRALAEPVSQAFKALTGDRYGRVTLGPDLHTESIEAKGQPREVDRMSLGAREQLATLMRLAIAGYLRTALVLDDQLVHSDSGRLAWFNTKLRESVRDHAHQVIVFTCRPADYLRVEAEPGVTEVDLTTVVTYPPPA